MLHEFNAKRHLAKRNLIYNKHNKVLKMNKNTKYFNMGPSCSVSRQGHGLTCMHMYEIENYIKWGEE